MVVTNRQQQLADARESLALHMARADALGAKGYADLAIVEGYLPDHIYGLVKAYYEAHPPCDKAGIAWSLVHREWQRKWGPGSDAYKALTDAVRAALRVEELTVGQN